jgi:hypothetical protein
MMSVSTASKMIHLSQGWNSCMHRGPAQAGGMMAAAAAAGGCQLTVQVAGGVLCTGRQGRAGHR